VQKSEHALKLATRIEHKIKEMGLKGYVTGREYLFNGINKYLVVSFYLSIGTTVLLISLGMTLYFKSLRLGLLSILPNIIPLTFGGFLMSLMGRPIDVGTVLVASVCFGIAIDDTIHIMVSYRESKNANDNLDDRLHYVFSHAGKSIITTTMILVFGFGTFFFAKFIPNWNFGVFSACLMLMALVVDLFMLPALFTFIHKPKRL
jgi:predicted RND superfamily exporter protein